MRRRSLVGLAAVALTLAGCGPAPDATPSEVAVSPCSSELPPRASPIDVPVAVLYVAGDDLPPVVGDVEWLGDDEPVVHEPVRPVHLQPFTVLQTQGQADLSLRMTNGVRIAGWTVDAVPDGSFRSGDFDTGRVRWSEGDEPTELVCIPARDGEWAIIADLTFADDAGNGTYYWRLNVSQTPGT